MPECMRNLTRSPYWAIDSCQEVITPTHLPRDCLEGAPPVKSDANCASALRTCHHTVRSYGCDHMCTHLLSSLLLGCEELRSAFQLDLLRLPQFPGHSAPGPSCFLPQAAGRDFNIMFSFLSCSSPLPWAQLGYRVTPSIPVAQPDTNWKSSLPPNDRLSHR